MNENGVWSRLSKKYYNAVQQDKHVVKPVILTRILPILFMLAIGFLIALIILIIEQMSTKIPRILKNLRNRKGWKTCKRHFCFHRKTTEAENSGQAESIIYEDENWKRSHSVSEKSKRIRRKHVGNVRRIRRTLPSFLWYDIVISIINRIKSD